MRKLLGVLAGGFLLIALSSSEALACRCVKNLTLRQAYAQSDVVVVGKVISFEVVDSKTQTAKAILAIDTAWKRQVPERLTVYTDSTCAFSFVLGKKYLLYLSKAQPETWGTSKCVGNKEVGLAGKPLRWLHRYAKRTTLTSEQKFFRAPS